MAHIDVTFGGLFVLVQSRADGNSHVILMSYPGVQHRPLLLLPVGSGRPDTLADTKRVVGDYTALLHGVEIPDIENYEAYHLDGVNLSFEKVVDDRLEVDETELPPSGCPESGWSSVNWLLNLNDAHPGKQMSIVRSIGPGNYAASTVQIQSGQILGRLPLERAGRGRKYRFADGTPRAFTDACQWRAETEGDCSIVLSAGNSTGRIDINGDLNGYVINFPTEHPSGPGGHVAAYEGLPLEPPLRDLVLFEAGECPGEVTAQRGHARQLESGGNQRLSVTVGVHTTTASSVSVDVAVTVDGHDEHRGRQIPEDQHGNTLGLLGEGQCVSGRVVVG